MGSLPALQNIPWQKERLSTNRQNQEVCTSNPSQCSDWALETDHYKCMMQKGQRCRGNLVCETQSVVQKKAKQIKKLRKRKIYLVVVEKKQVEVVVSSIYETHRHASLNVCRFSNSKKHGSMLLSSTQRLAEYLSF